MVFGAQILHFFALIVCVGVKSCWTYIYPGNSAYGIFAAIAVPLNIPHRNVFVSYNFEANYNLPGDAKTIIPGPLQRFTPVEEMNVDEVDMNNVEPEPQVVEEAGRNYQTTNSASSLFTNYKSRSDKNSAKPKALITRRAIYRILRDKLKASGFKGDACLLKLICEANASLLGRNNGVLGSFVHILLTPSTSSYENLPIKLYKAEENGVTNDCFQYENKCPYDILNLLSSPIEDFLYKNL